MHDEISNGKRGPYLCGRIGILVVRKDVSMDKILENGNVRPRMKKAIVIAVAADFYVSRDKYLSASPVVEPVAAILDDEAPVDGQIAVVAKGCIVINGKIAKGHRTVIHEAINGGVGYVECSPPKPVIDHRYS